MARLPDFSQQVRALTAELSLGMLVVSRSLCMYTRSEATPGHKTELDRAWRYSHPGSAYKTDGIRFRDTPVASVTSGVASTAGDGWQWRAEKKRL